MKILNSLSDGARLGYTSSAILSSDSGEIGANNLRLVIINFLNLVMPYISVEQ